MPSHQPTSSIRLTMTTADGTAKGEACADDMLDCGLEAILAHDLGDQRLARPPGALAALAGFASFLPLAALATLRVRIVWEVVTNIHDAGLLPMVAIGREERPVALVETNHIDEDTTTHSPTPSRCVRCHRRHHFCSTIGGGDSEARRWALLLCKGFDCASHDEQRRLGELRLGNRFCGLRLCTTLLYD